MQGARHEVHVGREQVMVADHQQRAVVWYAAHPWHHRPVGGGGKVHRARQGARQPRPLPGKALHLLRDTLRSR